jgi:transcriptional regulator with XRE-family HTH domain
MEEIRSFGKWLRHRRRELDLTQEELARQVGCAPITIRKLEGDEMRPSKQLAEALSQPLAIPSDQKEDFARFARADRKEQLSIDFASAFEGAHLVRAAHSEFPSGTYYLAI